MQKHFGPTSQNSLVTATKFVSLGDAVISHNATFPETIYSSSSLPRNYVTLSVEICSGELQGFRAKVWTILMSLNEGKETSLKLTSKAPLMHRRRNR